jgi:hypothetical protein
LHGDDGKKTECEQKQKEMNKVTTAEYSKKLLN